MGPPFLVQASPSNNNHPFLPLRYLLHCCLKSTVDHQAMKGLRLFLLQLVVAGGGEVLLVCVSRLLD